MLKLKRKFEFIQSSIKDMINLIHHIPKLIDQEHEAIKAHRLDLVQSNLQKKEDLKNNIESLITSLLKHPMITDPAHPLSKLDDVQEILNAEYFRLASEYQRALKHVKESFDNTFQNLKLTFKTARTSIDKNKIVLQHVLENHQKSYAFWSDLAQDSMASYDAKGKKPTPMSIGQFEVKV